MYSKNILRGTILLMVLLIPCSAISDESLKTEVENLVHKHYINGIPYVEAHNLGPEAVPYLVEMLQDPNEKEFWVNIIVTLGFIESTQAFDPLIAFLENAEGEVDIHTFRALLSVPFAIGCLGSTGDSEALNYLIGKINPPVQESIKWDFRGKNIRLLLSQRAIIGLAVSGRLEAKKVLLDLKRQIVDNEEVTQQAGSSSKEREALSPYIKEGLHIMERIEQEGRSHIFNS